VAAGAGVDKDLGRIGIHLTDPLHGLTETINPKPAIRVQAEFDNVVLLKILIKFAELPAHALMQASRSLIAGRKVNNLGHRFALGTAGESVPVVGAALPGRPQGEYGLAAVCSSTGSGEPVSAIDAAHEAVMRAARASSARWTARLVNAATVKGTALPYPYYHRL
jgi:hypothetical protein